MSETATSKPRKILFVASEAAPFIKTGGLADVAGALPKALFERGHDVRLVIPRYGDIDTRRFRLFPLMPEMKVAYGQKTIYGSVLRCNYPGTEMPVYFIEEPMFSLRKGVYSNDHGDFTDNDVRFSFFSMASLWLLKGLDWKPDVIHCNDWCTGLIPALLKYHPEICNSDFFQGIRSVFSVHNLAFQGNVDKFVLPNIGLPWDLFTSDGLEFYGKASFLKSGLIYGDEVAAVSPSYAEEIKTEEYGSGMEGALIQREENLHGILNGIDMDVWNPTSDPLIVANYSQDDLSGKAACKANLQKLLGLQVDPNVPVVGLISRLTPQKGIDLVAEVLEKVENLNAQFVILGTGSEDLEDALLQASVAHPSQVSTNLEYNEELSHKIIAGSDLFLVPSRFEPCGLTQMYAMRYGTVPVVRATGGLKDTVIPATAKTLKAKTATGYLFEEYEAEELATCLLKALEAYSKDADFAQLQKNGMARDSSWHNAAEQYEALYDK